MAGDWDAVDLQELTINFDRKRIPITKKDRKPGKYPYYGASGITDFVQDYIFDGEYLLISEDGDNLRTRQTPIAFLASGRFWVNNHAHIVQANAKATTTYLCYALQTIDITPYLSGSTRPKLTQRDLNSIKIPLPPLEEQKRIAQLLGSLDDKIELNRKMNETLEEMAQAIFKSWFVDFDGVAEEDLVESELGLIPDGWEVKTLNHMLDYAIGGQWGKAKPDEKHTRLVHCIRGTDIPDISLGDLGKPAPRYLKNSTLQKRKLQDGDIVFEISGGSPTQSTGRALLITPEKIQRRKEPFICSNFCRLIRPKSLENGTFIYHLLDYRYRRGDYFSLENGTTGIKNFPFTYFAENEPFLHPPEDRLLEFYQILQPLLKKIDENGIQSQTLSELRDTLLPKLISGELRIPEAEEQVSELIPQENGQLELFPSNEAKQLHLFPNQGNNT